MGVLSYAPQPGEGSEIRREESQEEEEGGGERQDEGDALKPCDQRLGQPNSFSLNGFRSPFKRFNVKWGL